MAKINVLDFEIANLIAAGEVVERPSSVLKELIENSIDSGARRIIAEIKRGGVALIRVTDDGCGMEAEDLPVSLKRHATSKIRNREDLDGITTLGFRGEALAAISAVSAVTIITKTASAEVGSMLTSEGGKILDISEVGTSDGTTVIVENLFFNVPARRKFLKKDSTEAMNVTALVEKVALSRPDIAIQLLIDGEEKFATPGNGDLKEAIRAIFGKPFAEKLIEADGEANGIRVHGFIGRSDNVRKNRNLQNVFINGRYVKSLTAMAAIEKAYTSYIAPEAFPVCVLFMDLDPRSVDVNVHPAKLEVKFANEQPVFEAVYHTVRVAIENYEYRPELSLATSKRNDRNPLGAFVPIGEDTRGSQISLATPSSPSTDPGMGKGRAQEFTPRADEQSHSPLTAADLGMGKGRAQEFTPRADEQSHSPLTAADLGIGRFGSGISLDRSGEGGGNRTAPRVSSGSGHGGFSDRRLDSESSMTPRESIKILQSYSQATADSAPTSTDPILPDGNVKIIGEAFDCYVLVEISENELLVIDKHAAHERVIFEQLKADREKDGRVASQALLLPITVPMGHESLSAADSYRTELESVGYEFSLASDHASLTAIPDAISTQDAEALFQQMTDELAEGRGNPTLTESLRRERALYQIACKAAIKGGRRYDPATTEWIARKVISLPDVTVCPHGRPIAFRLTKSELDRRFERLK